MSSIVAIAGIVLLIIVAVIILRIVDSVRSVLDVGIPVARALKEGLVEAPEELAKIPKSVSGMTSVCIPKITRDFPDFNWYEFKPKAENMLKSALMAISSEDISLVENASSDLRNQISLMIANNRDLGQKETFKDVTIHKTEIRDYTKKGGNCIITLQSAVGAYHYITKSGGLIAGSENLMDQTRYNIELVYIQDIDKVGTSGSSLTLTCKSCGAPIKSLGEKTCPYCGCAVEEINTHVWSLNRFYEN